MSNPRADRVRDTAALTGRSARLRRRQFLAEGPQAVREALGLHLRRGKAGTGPVVQEMFVTTDCLDRHPDLGPDTPAAAGIRFRLVTAEVLAAMSDTEAPQGVVAVCAFIDVPLETVLDSKPSLLAVLTEVRDPGNAGTILRAADSAGADGVIFTSSSVDAYNPKAVRSTVGSLFHLPVVVGADAGSLAAALRERGIAVLAADGYGTVDLDRLQDESAVRRLGGSPSSSSANDGGARLEAPAAWFFGNEAQGLPADLLETADHRVAVPVYGQAESLNVGTAATVCLYASARAQRRS
jgi:TrmH family RNA methyltransferase